MKFVLSKELIIWVVFYFLINLIYITLAGFGMKEFRYLIPVIMMIPIFLSFSLLYNLDDRQLLVTRKAIVVALIIGVLLLILDFIMPGKFTSDDNLSGRAVATYANANIAGAVLILGMILTIDIIDKKFRIYYLLFIFLGILVTFSRSNIMIYLIIIFLMSLQNKISKTFFFSIIITVFAIFMFLLFGGFELLSELFNLKITDNLVNRITFFLDSEHTDLSNISERKMVLMAALDMFADNPIFGNGFASTRLWEYRVAPHNSFARTFAEFGLFGIFIIPSFLYFTTRKVFKSMDKNYRDIGILFIVYYVLSSMFSHNMLDQAFNMVGAIIIATLGSKNLSSKGITNA